MSLPRLLPGLTEVASLACGGGHTLALLRDGRVLAWGRLGLGLGLGVGLGLGFGLGLAKP